MLLHEIVQNQAVRYPHSTAIVSGTKRVSYAQLDTWSTQLGHTLVRHGCQPGARIGLLLPKSIEAIVGMIGVLKAGAIYVPMDLKSPAARLAKIVDCCEPTLILASGSDTLVSELRAETSTTFSLGLLSAATASLERSPLFDWEDVIQAPTTSLNVRREAADPAHILFTSGSTGIPKGVVITHQNVVGFLNWANPYFGITAEDRNSCHPPLHFDLSTFDVYGTFLAGAELHLVNDQVSLLPQSLVNFIRTSKLTQWFSVPSALKFVAQFDALAQNDFPNLRRVLWCGEALPTPTLMYWMRRLPHVQFTNLYGPTEATIASSYHTIPAIPTSELEPIPIGTACGGEELQVLGDDLQPLPAGEAGDLYIGGVGLSPGYWRDAQKTASVFLEGPDGKRWYRTGDLARRTEQGLFYLIGRADSQIKSRGYRIELGEIEAALLTNPQIRECAVVAIQSESFDGNTICCAYVSAEGVATDPATLRENASRLIPQYMLPNRWMEVSVLPLNGNGKIDRPLVRRQFEDKSAAA